MTTVVHLATNQFIITRLVPVDGFQYRDTYATVTGCLVNLQPLSGQKTQLYGGAMGKTFVIYADGLLDVGEGDRFRDVSTNNLYQVVNGGVSRRTHGAVDYKEIVLQKIN